MEKDWLQPPETILTTRWQNRTTITRIQKWEEKQLYGWFKWLISNISHEKTKTWLRKGNLKRGTESFQITAQNNPIWNSHIKARIDKTQRLCGERDETINYIISECSKLTQEEYKARHHWVGKVIHWELCKKFRFDHFNKWYMHNPAAILENETHKLLWDFNIQTDHLIPTRRSDLIIISKKKKKTCKIVDFVIPADHRVKLKKSERKNEYLDLASELKKKTVENESDVYTNYNICSWYSYRRIINVLEDLEIRGQVETTQTTTQVTSARILRRVLETCRHSSFSEKPKGNADVKCSQRVNNNMCKQLKFDHTNKWYMHNPESVLENETHKLLWDFEIQTD